MFVWYLYLFPNIYVCRSACNPCPSTPWRQSCQRWLLMFVDPQYGTRFISLLWCLEFLSSSEIFWNICVLLYKYTIQCHVILFEYTCNYARHLVFGFQFLCNHIHVTGDRGGTVIKVLCYKFEGRWFASRWWRLNFSLTLGSTQPLTEMSIRRFSWG